MPRRFLTFLHLAVAIACAGGLPFAYSDLHSAPLDPAPGEVQIELRQQVAPGQREVKLGDVAIIRTRDYATIERLVGLPLGPAPREGTQAVLRREVLARWIRSQVGISRDQIAWSGPEQVVVRVGYRQAVTQQALPAATVPMVSRGDWIVLQLKSGAVELERRVEVMQDGVLGQVIKVRGENGASSVDGRVVAAGRVEALR
ncbi:flagella basal body P-ring formation protein FlgA [Caenimonas sp. SL110]|uniref:flagella basal body P-ring formation protein FlgA n=1 Tax=Caenimonas sp. SL110 TaxID=1450524 RepID=UPI0018726687|nr:flagella basal body P-ring formation protein FlgA [Caenimonas sp. SL110]